MRIEYINNTPFPALKPFNPKKQTLPEIQAGYALLGYRKESISTLQRIGLIMLSIFIVPLLIKDLRRKILQGKEIVYYCNKVGLPNKDKKIKDAIKGTDAVPLKTPLQKELDNFETMLNEEGAKNVATRARIDQFINNSNERMIKSSSIQSSIKIDVVVDPMTKLLNMTKEELRDEGKKNPFNYDLDSSPCDINKTVINVPKLLDQLPKEKAAYFLLGLLENSEVTLPFYIFCLRLINENFNDKNIESIPEKKKELYASVLFCLHNSMKLEAFFKMAPQYDDGKKKDGTWAPVVSSLLAFAEACIIITTQKRQKPLLMAILDIGYPYSYMRMPKSDKPNSMLEIELSADEKEFLITTAKETHVMYKNSTFSRSQ